MDILCACETRDGGYMLSGGYYAKDQFVYSRPFLIKLDGNGKVLWAKLVEQSNFTPPTSIFQDVNGDFITGSSFSANRGNTLRFDSTGELKWFDLHIGGYTLYPTADSGVIGITGDNIIKLDKSGERIWQRSVSNEHVLDSEAINNTMCFTADGNYVIGGTTSIVSQGDEVAVFAEQFSSSADLLWRHQYYSTIAPYLYCRASCSMPDSGFTLFGGTTNKFGIPDHPYLFQCDKYGRVKWAREIDAIGNVNPIAITSFPDGSVLAMGDQTIKLFYADRGFVFVPSILFFKLSGNGTLLWTKYMSIPDFALNAASITRAGEKILLSAKINGKTSPSRTSFFSVLDTTFSGCFLSDTMALAQPDSLRVLEGYTVGFGDSLPHRILGFVVTPTDIQMQQLCLLDVPASLPKQKTESYLFPNPVSSATLQLECSQLEEGEYTIFISNILGVTVWSEKAIITPAQEILPLSVAAIAPGSYSVEIQRAKGPRIYIGRFIKE